jgi:hypothetical protein
LESLTRAFRKRFQVPDVAVTIADRINQKCNHDWIEAFLVSHREVRSAESHREVRSAESHREVRSAESHREVRSAEQHREVRSAEQHREVRSAEQHQSNTGVLVTVEKASFRHQNGID